MAASAGDFAEAGKRYAEYRQETALAAADLKRAEPWSLFNPAVWNAHFEAVRRLVDIAKTSDLPR
jgi:hypothetical protein